MYETAGESKRSCRIVSAPWIAMTKCFFPLVIMLISLTLLGYHLTTDVICRLGICTNCMRYQKDVSSAFPTVHDKRQNYFRLLGAL
jgi:hypothetical protein